MDYFKFLPHKVTKMAICVSNGSLLSVQDSLCASHNASSPSQLTAQQSMSSLCLGDPRLPYHAILEMNSSEGSLFGKASFAQGYRLLISAKEKEHHYPH